MSGDVSVPMDTPIAQPAGRARRLVSRSLLTLGAALLLLTSFAVWVDRVALNTNGFVDTSSELIEDDAIRKAVATRAVDELYASVDVQAELKKQAPKDLKPLSGVAAAGLRQGAYVLVDRALQQPALQGVWRTTLRQSHTELVDVLEGGSTAVSTQSGVVTLDLREIVLDTAERIGIRDTAEEKLPADVAQVEILRSDELDVAQDSFRILKTLAWLLPILALLVFGIALWIATGRRRVTVRDLGIAVFVCGLVGLVAVNVTGNYVVDALAADGDSRAAGGDAWDILTELLRSSFRWQLVVGALFVLAAWLAGPRRHALAAREFLAPVFRERLYPYAALAGVALLLLLTGPVSDFARILYVIVFLALLVTGIEVLRSQTLHEFPDAARTVSVGDLRIRVSDWMAARRAATTATGAVPPPAQPAHAADLTSRLQSLAEMHAAGALTDEEYTAAKARVLAGE